MLTDYENKAVVAQKLPLAGMPGATMSEVVPTTFDADGNLVFVTTAPAITQKAIHSPCCGGHCRPSPLPGSPGDEAD